MAGNTSESVFLVKKVEMPSELSKCFIVKKRVLDHFFRCESLTNGDNSVIELSHILVKNIAGQTHIPDILVLDIMSKFLKEVKAFSEMLRSGGLPRESVFIEKYECTFIKLIKSPLYSIISEQKRI
jgi:hypothetical protein